MHYEKIITNTFICCNHFFTGTSIFAQAADNTVLTELALHKTTAYEYSVLNITQNEADIESERETKELDSAQLRSITNDKRFTGRQFEI
ncbi:hypothetical protein U7S25_001094 [Providencia rettgeri]|nr:hypothetical protein [Providencia rettgeri]ELQ1456400.1 hypothetical protein [Providencia rettgeri]ELR5185623.1 hypothetical protein [Providencia rettgeri]EMB0750463.1 hypothetical protein [Providencia rettgeri]